jgi:transcriptional regulator with XRE-family HTH domain
MTILNRQRLKKGLTLQQVGTLIGTDAANASRIERGEQRPLPERAMMLARLYGLSMEQVYEPWMRRQGDRR